MHEEQNADCARDFHMERVCGTMDDGQTDKKMDNGQTVRKNDASIQKDVFNEKHVPSYCRATHTTSTSCRTHVEYIAQR